MLGLLIYFSVKIYLQNLKNEIKQSLDSKFMTRPLTLREKQFQKLGKVTPNNKIIETNIENSEGTNVGTNVGINIGKNVGRTISLPDMQVRRQSKIIEPIVETISLQNFGKSSIINSSKAITESEL